jgi:hypothetical protein
MKKIWKYFKIAVQIAIVVALFFLFLPLLKSFFGSYLPSVIERTTHGVDLLSRFNEVKAKENVRLVVRDTKLWDFSKISGSEAVEGEPINDYVLFKGQEVILDPKAHAVTFFGRCYLKILIPNETTAEGYKFTGYIDARYLSVKDDSHNFTPSVEVLRPRKEPYVYNLGAGDASNYLVLPKNTTCRTYPIDTDSYYVEKDGLSAGSGDVTVSLHPLEKFRIRAKTAQIVEIYVWDN